MNFAQLEITCYEWPDRFLVESENEESKDYLYFFPQSKGEEVPPHFVDLSEWYCSCTDFRFNVLPNLGESDCRLTCKHIDAVLRYKRLHFQPPMPLPEQVTF